MGYQSEHKDNKDIFVGGLVRARAKLSVILSLLSEQYSQHLGIYLVWYLCMVRPSQTGEPKPVSKGLTPQPKN